MLKQIILEFNRIDISDVFWNAHTRQTKNTWLNKSNANLNGETYENVTKLDDMFKTKKHIVLIKPKLQYNIVTFERQNNVEFIQVSKANFFKYMKEKASPSLAHGCKYPDDAYINETTKNIFILEKKCQKQGGSVCEKLQTAVFKKQYYQSIIPDYSIQYLFVLNEWFESNCIVELDYLKKNKIPVFIYSVDNPVEWKTELTNFMCNYKLS